MKPSQLHRFDDIRVILDKALAEGTGTVVLPTHAAAVHWRRRAYKFRKLYAETVTASPYEKFVFPRVEDESCEVKLRIISQSAIFIPDGTEPVPADDPLLAEALKVKAKYGLDDEDISNLDLGKDLL